MDDNNVLQIHRGTLNASTAMSRNLKDGELFVETPASGSTDKRCRLKVGDGSTTYDDLPYLKDFIENEVIAFSTDTSASNIEALNKVVSGSKIGPIVSALRRAVDLNSNKINGIASGAEVNQNAFSNIKVNDSTVSARSKTDTLVLNGSNVTITPDGTNKKITIGITEQNVVDALGYTPSGTDTRYTAADGVALNAGTFTNSGVRDITTGTEDGTINMNKNGSTSNVAVRGVGSAVKSIVSNDMSYKATAIDGSTFTFDQTAFVGATDSTEGHAGYIPAPGIGNHDKFFRGDGSWAEAATVPEKLGIGYGVCLTETANADKTVSITNFELRQNGIVIITFAFSVQGSSTLNINNKGARPIYYMNTVLGDNSFINDGDIVTMVYDGDHFIVTSIESMTHDYGDEG